jgi:hypothetical protein
VIRSSGNIISHLLTTLQLVNSGINLAFKKGQTRKARLSLGSCEVYINRTVHVFVSANTTRCKMDYNTKSNRQSTVF